ncbi:CBS domain-containing protein [Chryseobacterium sp.]|uniref:CBS domain-containing protein n=1 Tax=Chryseobacterium sp. TaxID=1871047 RepID=UPI0025BADC2B|nr:CBS domain-containing protein [Chryseobacterium sp.]
MKQRVPVSQIMSTKLITLNTTNTLYDAEKLLKENNLRHLPVVDGKKLIGIISLSDLLKISYTDVTDSDEVESVVYETYTIPQIMAKTLVTIPPSANIKEVTELLSKHSFHSVPVVEDGELKGIVTTTDLLNYFLAQY